MKKNWQNDIHDRMSDYEIQEPKGLWEDVSKKMAEMKGERQVPRPQPFFNKTWRTATRAVVAASIVLLLGYAVLNTIGNKEGNTLKFTGARTNKQFVWLNAASIRLMRAAISWLKTHNQIVANLTQTPLLAHILQHIRNTLPTQLPPKMPQSAITQKKTAKLKRDKQQTINNPPTKIAIKTKKRKITVSVKIFLTAMWPTMVRERTIRTPQSHHDGQ